MRLPRFLEFLRPRLERLVDRVSRYSVDEPIADGLKITGHLLVEHQYGAGPRATVYDSKNFIVDAGISAVRDVLIGTNGGGFTGSVFRMAIGDGGVPIGELFSPKIPDATWPARTELFHEVIRQDISVFETPTPASMRFVGSFNSLDVDVTSFSLVDRVINEAALIIGDGVLTVGGDPKQVNKTPADTIDADEIMLSARTFRSVSFDPSEDVTITVTWTLTIAT